MPDPITSQLPDPQASVDAALGSAPTPTPVVPPDPVPAPVSEPMQPPTTTTVSSVPMGDDTPLAFVAKSDPLPNTENLGTSVPMDAIPTAPVPVPDQPTMKKVSVGKKLLFAVLAIVGLIGGLGLFAYQRYGTTEIATIAIVEEMDRSECDGSCRNGGYLVWSGGRCRVSGTCGSADNNNDGIGDKDTATPAEKAAEQAGTSSQCGAAGGIWCDYGFCIPQSSTKGCDSVAIDKGYNVKIGDFSGECVCDDSTCKLNDASAAKYAPYDIQAYTDANGKTPLDKANQLCADGKGKLDFGNAKYICKVGEKGYTSGACTEDNGKVFTGNELGCFCGTVQVDTGSGHMSYTSTCGCGESTPSDNPSSHKRCNPTTYACETVSGPGVDTCATDANCTNTPTMACTGLTSVPATVPAPTIGAVVKFTCAGVVTPTTAGTLTYKFRYSIDNGAFNNLASTGATANLTINACGTYKVQCQACTTLNGVLTCDPNNWTGATP